MRLGELAGELASTHGGDLPQGASAGVEITGLAYDSRTVRPGGLFFCVSGFRADGHDFAAQAVRRGAAALVVERPLGLGVPELVVDSVRARMAPLAARFYGHPSRELRVLGVTGTNGKTTSAYLLRALLEFAGEQCGLLGTVKSVIGARTLGGTGERAVQRTTPEAIDLQAQLREMCDGGDRACAMEVSSHALELGRVDAISFTGALFTNISRDHLDFHETMENYYAAKRLLFLPADGEPPAVSVVNLADAYGRRLATEIDGARTFAVDASGDYSASELRCRTDGCSFTLHTPVGKREVELPMPGRFNVANALGALALAHALGYDLDTLVAGLEAGVRVPGRFEPVEEGQDFAVLIDYAHTPDSLENVLSAARELGGSDAGGASRVICVFGAGGDRDRGKRPLMGEVAARLADVIFVTSDNPRSENPERIIEEIMGGVRRAGHRPGAGGPQVRAIADRRAAIGEAIAGARPGDALVIAGKGHEQGQELADGRKLPFDDVAVAREALLGAGVAGAGAT
jgi:UDP-N-acetylmuramoyl-L-alanyl-D-glutamate--2,6-diaminopimelate ligase